MSVKNIQFSLFFQFELYVCVLERLEHLCILYLFKSTHLFHIIVKAYKFATRPENDHIHEQFLLSLVVLL